MVKDTLKMTNQSIVYHRCSQIDQIQLKILNHLVLFVEHIIKVRSQMSGLLVHPIFRPDLGRGLGSFQGDNSSVGARVSYHHHNPITSRGACHWSELATQASYWLTLTTVTLTGISLRAQTEWTINIPTQMGKMS